ncbi:D-alanine--D-alanine ligase [Candidatus Beckwithbacteria bacterium]|nr:D-alanine--D-alanine ligase [Candidatus Beckwithbacteria bacterium]
MTIGVFFGGQSPEHDISIITGQLVIAGLKKLGHQVISVYISKQGEWLVDDKLGNLKTFQNPDKLDSKFFTQYAPFFNPTSKKLELIKKGMFGKSITLDVAFPTFHGQNGEDGTIQGLFELANVPYVGCGVTASALSVDKVLTKKLYQYHGVPTTKFMYFYQTNWEQNQKQILADCKKSLSWPLVVKPARLGSSIAVTKVATQDELIQAIEVALHYETKVLVEECVENLMDITCAVLGNDNPKASLLQESSISQDLLSYEDKYLKEGGTQLGKAALGIQIPANLPAALTKEIQETAKLIYSLFECAGTTRVDFLYNQKTKKFFANEINTLPGTLYHHLWQRSGIELDELLETLIKLAQEKHTQKQVTTKVFESSVLQKATSAKLQIK